MHDLKLLKKNSEGFVGVPKSLFPYSGYREAESAYIFDGISLKPVFKRWTRQRSPPELYNGGFEDMESMGAVYSRISSHILGDWNACGKVMGLAPWASMHRNQAKGWLFSSQNIDGLGLGSNFFHTDQYMVGNPFEEESFKVNWGVIENLGPPNRYSDEKFGLYANIARSVQTNLEACAISLVSSLQKSTGKENIVLTGGVALNSVLNGRISREMGFKNVFVPPGPGDEGIAVIQSNFNGIPTISTLNFISF
jgi:predicted NodU family carbamoyl transferase